MTAQVALHQAAREIFDQALLAVDPIKPLRRGINFDGKSVSICGTQFDITTRPVYVVAIGKAAPLMAITVGEILKPILKGGIVSGPYCEGLKQLESSTWSVFKGGHPLPNEASLAAAQAAFDLLRRAKEAHALVIFLVSGGGSAMLEWPRNEGISLSDFRETNRQLTTCGASITEINTIRRALSAVKGGRLGAIVENTDQFTLIISDTNRGDEASVASGPTLSPLGDGPRPGAVMDRYGLRVSLPASVVTSVEEAEKDNPFKAVNRYQVLLDNQNAIEAAATAARQLGFAVEVAQDVNEQPIEEGVSILISRLISLKEKSPHNRVCLISGGEFSCVVRGTGVGGRNLETVLRCAIELDRNQHRLSFKHFVALSAGTDGLDGNSPAAGAIADENSIARAVALGLDAVRVLQNSDAFNFFSSLGDAILTGPTGTNVRDLRILIA